MPEHNSNQILYSLYSAGNMDRVEKEALRFLSINPEDASAHYFLTLALGNMERFKEAKKHLEFILNDNPDELRNQIAAINHYTKQGRWSAANTHVGIALRLEPESALVQYYAALVHVNRLSFKKAKIAIERARQLDPHDADIANLHIRIHSLEETSIADGLKRLSEYEDALKLDPDNAWLHNSIGDVYATDLGDPATAQSHYREALRLKPDNRDFQKDLFSAVAESNLIYRFFSIPSRAFNRLSGIGTMCRYQPWRILIFLICIKFVFFYAAWLIMVTVLFWPGCKAYEWLLVNEIKRGSVTDKVGLKVWAWFRQWPASARFGLFLLLNLLLWAGLFQLLDIRLQSGFIFVAVVAGLHFGYVVLNSIQRRADRYLAQRSLRKRNSRTNRRTS